MIQQPPPSGADDDRQLFQRLLGYYDAPAFMRRARRLEDAERILAEHLTAKRAERLSMVRLRVGQLRPALAGEWSVLRPLLANDAALGALQSLHDELQPVLRLPLDATRSLRALRHALGELVEAMTSFNHRWARYLAEFDLTPINKLRDGYNRHYLIEKECALRDARAARLGFKRLDPITTADLLRQYPLLPSPGDNSSFPLATTEPAPFYQG